MARGRGQEQLLRVGERGDDVESGAVALHNVYTEEI